MTLAHAVVWTDHQTAKVLQFDAEQVLVKNLHTHTHNTPQHGSGVRSEHEFFGQICSALEGIGAVLVTGSHKSLADFRHYVDKHRAEIAKHVVAYEVVDHPSENQLVALARDYFAKREQIAGKPASG